MIDDAQKIAIRPLTEADANWLWEMLYQAIYVPSGAEAPPREVIHEPGMAHYAADWGRPGDIGYLAVDAHGQPGRRSMAQIAGRPRPGLWLCG